jgi:hypothetical protein
VIIQSKAFAFKNILSTVSTGRFFLLGCILLVCSCGSSAAEYGPVCYIQFQQQNFSVCQNETNAVITVTRSGDFRNRAVVDFEVNDGTATAGEDYRPVGGQLIFAPFENRKTFSVPIIPNQSAETNRTVQLTLLNAAYHATIVQPEATLFITRATPAVPLPPPISIASESAGIVAISWPGDRLDCSVERTDDPSKPWSTISASPYQMEGRLVIEEPATNILYLYRLRLN